MPCGCYLVESMVTIQNIKSCRESVTKISQNPTSSLSTNEIWIVDYGTRSSLNWTIKVRAFTVFTHQWLGIIARRAYCVESSLNSLFVCLLSVVRLSSVRISFEPKIRRKHSSTGQLAFKNRSVFGHFAESTRVRDSSNVPLAQF